MDHSESCALLPQEARLEDHHEARRATLHVSRFHYLLASNLVPCKRYIGCRGVALFKNEFRDDEPPLEGAFPSSSSQELCYVVILFQAGWSKTGTMTGCAAP